VIGSTARVRKLSTGRLRHDPNARLRGRHPGRGDQRLLADILKTPTAIATTRLMLVMPLRSRVWSVPRAMQRPQRELLDGR